MIWTDTFANNRQSSIFNTTLGENNARLAELNRQDIRVIIGNPPYSVGQDNANDDNQNEHYEELDERIAATYAARTEATLKNSLYDSYIRAYRWASDRIGEKGIISFVTNAGWIDSNSADGMRKCLAEEFSAIYVYHLKGNARTQSEQRRKEKDNVFGEGSRAPVAIVFLVKNPEATEHGKIYFYDNGIRNALLKNFAPVPAREDKGALWENLFFTERLKLHAFRRDGGEIYFWRTKKQHEMDFIEIVNGTIAAFECKAGNKINSTSIKAFSRAYPNIPVTVVSPDNIDQEPAEPASLANAFDAPPNP